MPKDIEIAGSRVRFFDYRQINYWPPYQAASDQWQDKNALAIHFKGKRKPAMAPYWTRLRAANTGAQSPGVS